MKTMLLFLLALTVAPAWAADAASAMPAKKSAAFVTETGALIEMKGPAKSVSALLADMEKDAAYKDAACTTAKKPGKTARISCAKADGALMSFLSKNAQAVHWSISAVASKHLSTATSGCAIGCVVESCPPPSGPVACCNTTTGAPC